MMRVHKGKGSECDMPPSESFGTVLTYIYVYPRTLICHNTHKSTIAL